jgi:hypothetical protein
MTTDYNESIKYLQLFNEQANTLKRLNFVKTIFNQKTGVQDSASQGEPFIINRSGPNEESIRAFVLTFRYFIQDKDGISFRKLAEHYNNLPISEEKKDKYNVIRESITNFLNSKSQVNINNSTNGDIIDVFIYGELAHINSDKKKIFDYWMSKPIANTLLIDQFVYILGIITIRIEAIKNQNLEVFKELNA